MDTPELAHVIEAILFVAGEPVNVKDLQKALEATEDETRLAIDALESDYSYHRRGICLKRFGEHIQLSTRAEYAPYVERLLQPIQKQSLSQSALETLAVVAYRQPVTRLDIEAVRGVKCDYSVQSLVNKGLIQEVGRKEALGRPILYGTTDKFLSHFGLSSLEELPAPPEPANQEAEESDPLVP
nr:Segregation and condensation protein B [uncultured bacterium]